jgi:hypothetical protein
MLSERVITTRGTGVVAYGSVLAVLPPIKIAEARARSS